MKTSNFPLLTQRILSDFRKGMECGHFYFFGATDRYPHSIRQYLQEVLPLTGKRHKSGVEIPLVKDIVSISLTQFLNTVISIKGGHNNARMQRLVLGWLISIVPNFLTLATSHRPSIQEEVDQQNRLKTEAGGNVGRLSADSEFCVDLAKVLLAELIRTHGTRSLRSFFVIVLSPAGFRTWREDLYTGLGTPLKKASIGVGDANVDVRLIRYDNEIGVPVQAYEWMAELRVTAGSEVPDAFACGMFYKFKADSEGYSIGDANDLLTAADEIADVDILQVKAFLDQHDDSEALIAESDICFVWCWERRAGASKGLGRDCLVAAIENLKKRFKRLVVVVFDLKPSQFISLHAAEDPAEIQAERAEAIEKISAYVDEIDPGEIVSGSHLFIFNHDGSDTDAAAIALASTFL